MTSQTTPFLVALMQELMASMTNWYGADNWDAERFGPYRAGLKSRVATALNGWSSGRFAIVYPDVSDAAEKLRRLEPLIDKLGWLYDRLADNASRATLVKVIAYRLLGQMRVMLPLNNREYWLGRQTTNALIKGDDKIGIGLYDWNLRRFDLAEAGYPIELFCLPLGVFATFVLRQYEYQKRTPPIRAQADEYVIDAGGCWGDTALYFAHRVGDGGRVYSFEFAPENLAIFERNLAMNPGISKRISIFERALWDRSGEQLAYSANGPGTSLGAGTGKSQRVSTQRIDDFVHEERPPRVDFIKMDVEGAELCALRGAEGTMQRFRPTLAISIYHKEADLVDIPVYLDELHLDYEFFLDHYTIHQEETVLFAIARDRH